MMAYPYVHEHKGTRRMVHNGNGFGGPALGQAMLDNT